MIGWKISDSRQVEKGPVQMGRFLWWLSQFEKSIWIRQVKLPVTLWGCKSEQFFGSESSTRAVEKKQKQFGVNETEIRFEGGETK